MYSPENRVKTDIFLSSAQLIYRGILNRREPRILRISVSAEPLLRDVVALSSVVQSIHQFDTLRGDLLGVVDYMMSKNIWRFVFSAISEYFRELWQHLFFFRSNDE